MTEEERQRHVEERNARGAARKAERQGEKARMEQVGPWGPAAVTSDSCY